MSNFSSYRSESEMRRALSQAFDDDTPFLPLAPHASSKAHSGCLLLWGTWFHARLQRGRSGTSRTRSFCSERLNDIKSSLSSLPGSLKSSVNQSMVLPSSAFE